MQKKKTKKNNDKDFTVLGMVTNMTIAKARNGQDYASFRMIYQGGDQVPGRIWNINTDTFNVEPGKVFTFIGKYDEYNGTKQAIISSWSHAKDAMIENFLPSCTRETSKNLADQILSIIEDRVTNSFLKDVCLNVFTPTMIKRFMRAPGGSYMHHAYIGGLAHHTRDVMVEALHIQKKATSGVCSEDLLVAGAALHDIGKVFVYDISPGFPWTVRGALFDHIVMGSHLVMSVMDKLIGKKTVPKQYDALAHIILSHHGKREWGSPVVPQTPEAVTVFQADYLNSKIAGMEEITLRGRRDGHTWTERSPILDGAKLYLI